MKETIGVAGAGAFLGYLMVDQNIQLVTQDLGVSDPVVGAAGGAVVVVVLAVLAMEDYELME